MLRLIAYIAFTTTVLFCFTTAVADDSALSPDQISAALKANADREKLREVACETTSKPGSDATSNEDPPQRVYARYIANQSLFNYHEVNIPIQTAPDDQVFTNNDSIQIVYDGAKIYYINSAANKGISDVVIERDGTDYEKVFWSTRMDSVSVGILPGDVDTLANILKKSRIIGVTAETVDGQDCEKVSFSGPCGNYQIWLNKIANWQLQKAHVEKSSSSIIFGKTLAEELAEVKQIPKPGQEQRYTLDIVNMKFEIIKGNSIISEFDARVKYWTGDHFWSDRINHHKRLKVTLPSAIPDSELAPKIPNGTPVSYLRVPTLIPHMWKDGTVVKAIDPSSVKKLDDTINEGK